MPRGTPGTILALTLALAAVGCSASSTEPRCRPGSSAVSLMAESVPTATLVPCVELLPDGWSFEGFRAESGSAAFSLDHEDGRVLDVRFQRSCRIDGDPIEAEAPSSIDRFRSESADATRITWISLFDGGCAVEMLSSPRPIRARDEEAIHDTIGYLSRSAARPA